MNVEIDYDILAERIAEIMTAPQAQPETVPVVYEPKHKAKVVSIDEFRKIWIGPEAVRNEFWTWDQIASTCGYADGKSAQSSIGPVLQKDHNKLLSRSLVTPEGIVTFDVDTARDLVARF